MIGSSIGFIYFINVDGESIELVVWLCNMLDKYCIVFFDFYYLFNKVGIWVDVVCIKVLVMINDYVLVSNKCGLFDGYLFLIWLFSVLVMEVGKVYMMIGVGNKGLFYIFFDVEMV